MQRNAQQLFKFHSFAGPCDSQASPEQQRCDLHHVAALIGTVILVSHEACARGLCKQQQFHTIVACARCAPVPTRTSIVPWRPSFSETNGTPDCDSNYDQDYCVRYCTLYSVGCGSSCDASMRYEFNGWRGVSAYHLRPFCCYFVPLNNTIPTLCFVTSYYMPS